MTRHITLSDESKEILQQRADGMSIKEIAAQRGRKEKAVAKQIERIRLMLGCKNTIELIHLCNKKELI